MATSRFCTECGKPLQGNAKFCASCGQAIIKPPEKPQELQEQIKLQPQEQEQQAVTQQPQPTEPPQQQTIQYQEQIELEATVVQPMLPMQKQPPQVQPVQYRQQQQYEPALKKKKSPVVLILAIFGSVFVVGVVTVVLIINAVTGILKNTQETDFFEIGGDKIPSVKYILGEKKTVTGVSTSISNGIEEKIITYSVSENQNAEMREYALALIENYGYYHLNDNAFSGSVGRDFQFGANSAQEGYIIIIHIDYDTNGYTLTLTRGKGALTFN